MPTKGDDDDVKPIGEAGRQLVEHVRRVAHPWQQDERFAVPASVQHVQTLAIGLDGGGPMRGCVGPSGIQPPSFARRAGVLCALEMLSVSGGGECSGRITR